METKLCKKCGKDKPLDEMCTFKNKTSSGFRHTCKLCNNKIVNEKKYYLKRLKPLTDEEKEYHKNYRKINKDRIKERDKFKHKTEKAKLRQKKYNEKNADTLKLKRKQYYINNIDKFKEYRELNKPKRNEQLRVKRKNDFFWQLKNNTRTLIYQAIVFRKFSKLKGKSTEEILGCTFEEFRQHLESKFEAWMNWDNYGLYNGELNYGWDIDHIIPLSSVDTLEEIYELNHYTNLQPLCGYTNRYTKRDNY
jgi:hypothetical protein